MYIRFSRYGFLSIILISMALSCSSRKTVSGESDSKADALIARGKELYEKGKFGKAVETFTEFVYSYPYHSSIAEGTYLLAESYYRDGQYDLAASEFKRVSQRFEESEYAERSELMIGEAMLASSSRVELEQDKTALAMEAFREFLTYYPGSELLEQAKNGIKRCREKLAEKEYKTAKLYFKLKKPNSVVLYADIIAEEYAGTSWVPKALLLKGSALFKLMEQPESAAKVYREIIERYPDSDAAGTATERLSEIAE